MLKTSLRILMNRTWWSCLSHMVILSRQQWDLTTLVSLDSFAMRILREKIWKSTVLRALGKPLRHWTAEDSSTITYIIKGCTSVRQWKRGIGKHTLIKQREMAICTIDKTPEERAEAEVFQELGRQNLHESEDRKGLALLINCTKSKRLKTNVATGMNVMSCLTSPKTMIKWGVISVTNTFYLQKGSCIVLNAVKISVLIAPI